ncbi:MAG: fibronectin type III domain-containing protein, partial [Lachnospiraceae bacterium]|nr:fibronectin type III domain-containing protein [Lachnospiraceae bacterium]
MKTGRLFKTIVCLLAVLALTAGSVPEMQAKQVKAATTKSLIEKERTGEEIFNTLMSLDATPPALYKKNTDPYGYAVDEPFYLTRQHELLVYSSSAMYNKPMMTMSVFDNLAPENSGVFLDLTKLSSNLRNIDAAKLNYVQLKAFDPTGSGRKDHLALIGVKNNGKNGSNDLYVYVCDKTGSTWQGTKLGSVNWMGNTSDGDDDDVWLFNAMNFLSLTAGDYDGDGKDSLVVWGCYDNTNYGLNEITVNPQNLKLSVKGGSTHNKTLLHNIYINGSVDSGLLKTNNWVDNHLGAKVDSGDINGDGYDDLVVLSYVSHLTESYNGRKQKTDLYRPYVAVAYGKKGLTTDITKINNRDTGIWSEAMNSTGTYDSCVAPGLSLGDVDGDGVKEIVVAGIHNTIEGTPGKAVSNPYSIDNNTLYIMITEGDLTHKASETPMANAWTSDGFYPNADDVWQQTAVQCVSINGYGNAALMFISGDLYSFSNSTIRRVYEGNYFKQADNKDSDGNKLSNTFIHSVAAGNFDGNEKGFEQLVFSVGLMHENQENYTFTRGMMGGADRDESTGISASYYSTTMGTMDASSSEFPSGGSSGANLYFDGKSNYALNYAFCAIDTDNDGVVARYKGKAYTFSDPEVMAVIQAAPYYEDMYDYITDSNSTEYSIFENFNYEQSSSNSVSFGIGVTAEISSPAIEMSVSAGYSMDWSQTFTKGLEKSTTYSWTATWEDEVIVKRTPIVIYSYEIMKDGQWLDGQGMSLSFATNSSFMKMNIDEYNAFVDYYNEKLKNSAGYDSSKAGLLMTKLDDERLQNEGNPLQYLQLADSKPAGFVQLQDTAQTCKTGSGNSAFSLEQSNYEGYSESQSHGFSYESSIMLGVKVLGDGVMAGVTSSLSYMSGKETSTTKGYGKGIGATVSDIDNKLLAAAAGDVYDLEEAAKNYVFSWQVVKWDSNITDSIGHKVPIYGYMISNVKTPSPKVNDFYAEIVNDPNNASGCAIKLMWENPTIDGNPDWNKPNGYRIFLRGKDQHGKMTRFEIAQAGPNETEYLYHAPDGIKEFVFTITSFNNSTFESVESDTVTVVLDTASRSIISVKKTATDGINDTYTIFYNDGTKSTFLVRNGEDGAGIETVKKAFEDETGTTFTITMTDGRSSTFSVPRGEAGAGITSIFFTESNDNVDTYTIMLDNGQTSSFEVKNGKSAYDIAKDYGFDGSETEWLDSLKGTDGRNGYNGSDGRDGRDGVDGKDGKDGKDGEKGEKGDKGDKGEDGIGVAGISITESGDLIFTLTDNNTIVAGNLLTLLLKFQESQTLKDQEVELGSVKAGAGSITVKWAQMDNVDGYEISYSSRKNMKKAKTVTIDDPETVKRKLTGLSGNTKYYIQIRGFILLGTEKVYTEWSD